MPPRPPELRHSSCELGACGGQTILRRYTPALLRLKHHGDLLTSKSRLIEASSTSQVEWQAQVHCDLSEHAYAHGSLNGTLRRGVVDDGLCAAR